MKSALQPSKQARSQATQERILDATARLLEQESFESISVRRIVEEASASIGSFYGRFRDKDALLPVLFAKQELLLEKRIALLRREVGGTTSLDAFADRVANHFVVTYGHSPNLSRALFEYATRAPESEEANAFSAQRMRQYQFLIEACLRYENEITHPQPDQAVEIGLYFLTVACRNRVFHPLAPQSRTVKLPKRQLRSELARMFVGYLTV